MRIVVQCVGATLRGVEGGRRHSWWRRVAGMSASAVERCVGGRVDYQKNIDLAFKKPYLRTLTKPATNLGKTMVNLNNAVKRQNIEVAILGWRSRTRR